MAHYLVVGTRDMDYGVKVVSIYVNKRDAIYPVKTLYFDADSEKAHALKDWKALISLCYEEIPKSLGSSINTDYIYP